MTVKDLIARLQTCDPEQQVVLSRDAEGNVYSPLAEVAQGAFQERVSVRQGKSVKTLPAAPCLVLWPRD